MSNSEATGTIPPEYSEIVSALKAAITTQSLSPEMLEKMKGLKVTMQNAAEPNLICNFDWNCVALK